MLLLGGVFLFTVLADRGLGMAIRRQTKPAGLIFPPGSRYTYKTPEFVCEAINNSLGFRDREFDLNKRAKLRVIAIGDSFTFGWGVNIEQSWPKVLESNLRSQGYDVEIANLGEPGASPFHYAGMAERAVPLFKPDLIIVGVLQGDDLTQLAQPPPKSQRMTKARQVGIVKRILWRLYPYSLSVIEGERKLQPLRGAWKADGQRVIDELNPEERMRFEKLDSEVQQLLRNGEINPFLLHDALSQPDYWMKTIQLDAPETRLLIAKMALHFSRIEKVAAANNSRLLIVSVPYGAYVSQKDFDSRRRIGFTLTQAALESNAPDEAIKIACDSDNLRFVSVTAEVRRAAKGANLYYNLDGHFNATGYKTFADSLSPIIEKEIKTY